MSTLAPKFFCPRCRAAFDVDSPYCGRCGANMHRASRLARAELDKEADARAKAAPPADRRRGEIRDPWLGRVVDGRYRVVEVIGRGGMGAVYKVEHQRMGKIAAMKVLHRELATEREVVRRFRREAEAVSRLTHPNSVQVFDFGEAQGALYLVMEYVRGRDLSAVIERDGPLPLARAAPLVVQIADALAEAHELGVIHRDLKPENVLVTRTHGGHDFIKVLDFGLAKLTEREEVTDVTTHAGSIMGTPHYMSPEQIRGEEIDRRTDVYSLGALLYRVLTGVHAFDAPTPVGVLTKHITEPLVPPSRRRPDLDPRIDEVAARAMAKSPSDRYRDTSELVADLQRAARGRATASHHDDDDDAGAGARAAAGTGALTDPVDYGIDSQHRLRRADVDAFERALRRRRWLRRALVPILLAGAVAATLPSLLSRDDRPRTEEVEPNDHLETATPIASGVTARGHIGKRLSRDESDRDFYRIVPEPDPDEEFWADVRATGLPNMSIQLALYAPTGEVLARVDEGGVGDGERLRHRVRGPFFILVTESRSPGALPTENVSDAYEITATLEPVSGAAGVPE